ncbi:uncharacterized protein TNCV_4122651 [Trichonephila clavipes]|nr:uncharacterized protein TNCV_4122651 [Trichonephila clavipes]
MEVTRVEQRSYIKIAALREKTAVEYHSELVEAIGNNALPYRIVARRKTDFFPEEDTTKSYSGFEPEPTRLQAEAVMRPILAYAFPVWGYAAKTNINILDTLQNSLIRMIVKAIRYMRNDDIRKALKINSFKSHIQNIAINFLTI